MVKAALIHSRNDAQAIRLGNSAQAILAKTFERLFWCVD